jgi:anion-transporting  ArsA/GET3 family ATPase
MSLAGLLNDGKVVVTVGAGGVGKTSLAAALGLRSALAGKNVMVVTIDPARRLATALGLSKLDGQISSIELNPIDPLATGRLDIMMLNPREVFDRLMVETVADVHLRAAILQNPFYRRFTQAMSGTQEHAAVEELYDLVEKGSYDLIVLDTPPSRHALEFLHAPRRLLEVLDDAVLRWLVRPAQGGMMAVSIGSRYIARMLSFFAGAEMLAELADFLSLMAAHFGGLRNRAARVEELLKDPSTRYLVVASTERHGLEGGLMFDSALRAEGFNVVGFVLNRVVTACASGRSGEEIESQLKRLLPEKTLPKNFSERLVAVCKRRSDVAAMHAEKIRELEVAHPDLKLFVVPRLDQEIVDLHSVHQLAKNLFGE